MLDCFMLRSVLEPSSLLCLVSLKLFFISLGDSYCNNISMALVLLVLLVYL